MSRKELPNPTAGNFLTRLREEVQTYLGRQGDPMDRGITLRDLIEGGVVKLRSGFNLRPGQGGGLLPIEPVVVDDEIDLTPPTTPSGFVVDAAITHVFIEHDAPLYRQGHGHKQTRVYGVTYTAGDPLPTFTDAVEITQFTGTVHAHPSNPATTWRLWIKWETNDGVLSAAPAGGTNGLEVTTGQDVAKLLEALTGQITESQLFNDLGTRINLIDGNGTGSVNQRLAQEELARVQGLAAEAQLRADADAAEAQARATAIAQEMQARVADVQAESAARTNEILAVQADVLADMESADNAVKALLRSEFTSADASTLSSALNYTYSKAQTDGAIAAQGTTLTANFTAADAATLASAQNFTYSKSTIDAATAATMQTLRSEFAAADTSTLASAQNYTYSKAQTDSAIATSTSTLRAQITGGYTGTDLNALASGLLFQERTTRAAQDAALSQQITLLSAGAGEQFDYSKIWYFDTGVESWTGTSGTTTSAVAGWLRQVGTSGTVSDPQVLSPDNLGIDGAKYPQVRIRIRKVGTPTWEGKVYFTTTVDNIWTEAKALALASPSFDANGISVLTFDMPATWTGATVRRLRLDLASSISTTSYFDVDWVAVGRPSPGASSAQLLEEQLARTAADDAEAAARTALAAEVAGKASGAALSALETRVTTAEGVNTSQGASITSLNNSLTTLTGTVNNKADATALTALTTRVTAAESVNTTQSGNITTLTSSLNTLTGTVNNKADATALTALTTRVTAAESVNTTQSGNITTLTSSLNTLTATVNTKASASALSDLTTRVTSAEEVNTTQANSITSLNSSLSTTNTNVTAAQTAANNAATLAGSKGKVMVQTTAPAAADQLAQNLWIDITGGANTPKRWTGTAWAAVTDKVATDAAAAAAAAQATANLKADVTALNALTTTVTGQGSSITAQGTRINALESTVNNPTTGVAATASELTAVKTTVNHTTTGVVATATKTNLLQSQITNGQVLPNDFKAGLIHWTGSRNGNPDTVATYTATTVTDDVDFGVCAVITNLASTGANICTKGVVPAVAGRVYRVRSRFKVDTLPTDGSVQLSLIACNLSDTYANPTSQLFTATTVSAAGQVVELENKVSSAASTGVSAWTAGTKYLRFGLRLNSNETGLVLRVQSITVEDITDAQALSAAITTEASTRASADTALANQITTLSSTVNGNTAAIQTEATTRATQTGELYAQYTVKTDVAGLVSGYGLASSANNAAPTSSFGVRASNFFVAPPSVTSATAPTTNLYAGYVWRDTSVTPNVTKYYTGSAWSTTPQALPFVIQTSATTINEESVPAGVYINDAYIKNGTITNAKIANLAVDNAKIANVSVDKLTAGTIAVGQYIQSTSYVAGTSGWKINGDGNAELSNATVRGTVYATNGQFWGALLGGAASAYATGLGFYAGGGTTSNGASYRWRVGNPTGARIQWNGSAVEVYNASNQLTISSGGISASYVSGLGTLATQNSVSTGQVTGLGTLATQNSVNWNSQITNVPAFGNFAYLSSITSANISTYIAGAAIGTAYIADAAITQAQIADAAITNAKIGSAAVDTLQLAGQAVTLPISAYTAGPIELTTSYIPVQSANITLSENFPVVILFSFLNSSTNYAKVVQVRISRDTTVVFESNNFQIPSSYANYYLPPISFNIADSPGAGSFTYKVEVRHALYALSLTHRSLTLIGFKR